MFRGAGPQSHAELPGQQGSKADVPPGPPAGTAPGVPADSFGPWKCIVLPAFPWGGEGVVFICHQLAFRLDVLWGPFPSSKGALLSIRDLGDSLLGGLHPISSSLQTSFLFSFFPATLPEKPVKMASRARDKTGGAQVLPSARARTE